jgi:hypothetical protein
MALDTHDKFLLNRKISSNTFVVKNSTENIMDDLFVI